MSERKSPASRSVSSELPRVDRAALAALPWEASLEDWPALGVQAIYARRGESRHTVLFVEAAGRRYVIKETSPEFARKEICQLIEIRRRGIYAVEPVGVVIAPGPPIAVGEIAGVTQYVSGDKGYCITRLAQRVIPQALLYRYPFTRRNRETLWNAIIALLLNLHDRGVFWGDPSLANVLIDLSQHKVRALLADAETVELYPGPLEENRRQEDLAALQESLLWTGEDIRQARGDIGPTLITQEDLAYIAQRYTALRRMPQAPNEETEAADAATGMQNARPLTPVERVAGQLYELGYSILDLSRRAILATGDGLGAALRSRSLAGHAETARPRWYQQRIQELLGVRIPRPYARQFYEAILGHKWLLGKQANREVSLEEAARHWYERYHLPTITLLRAYFPSEADSLEVYFGVLARKWQLSLRAGFEVSLEEAAIDYALRHARSADLLHRAFTAVASLLPQRSELLPLVRPEDQRLEPPAPPE